MAKEGTKPMETMQPHYKHTRGKFAKFSKNITVDEIDTENIQKWKEKH